MATYGSFENPSRRLALVGVPIEDGANVTGSCLAPSALRMIGLPSMLGKLGCDVVDHGDLAPAASREPERACTDERARKASKVARWIPRLEEAAYDLVRGGDVPVFIGGDHSLSTGTVRGAARHFAEVERELFILWLDAHADFNTPATSPSGNMHGMALAYLCGEAGFQTVLGAKAQRVIVPSNVFLFGTRSIDAGESELLRRRGVNIVGMREIERSGVAAPMRRILDTVASRGGVLHVSFDADLIDPLFVPGVNVPAPGGVTYVEAHVIMELLNERGLVASLDVTELNPLLDVNGRSTRVVAELVACLFDQKTSGRHDHARTEARHGQHAA